MRFELLSLLAALGALSPATVAQSAQPSVEVHRLEALHPHKLLSMPGYAAGWRGMLTGMNTRGDDYWISDAGGPGSIKAGRAEDGRDVAVANLCKPHDCYDYNFMFVIDPVTKKMWGLKRTRGDAPKTRTFYVNPDVMMQRYLELEMRQEYPDT